MEEKFEPLKKNKKQFTLRWNFSEQQPGIPFLTTKGMKKFWKR